jgi:hypothetical protein
MFDSVERERKGRRMMGDVEGFPGGGSCSLQDPKQDDGITSLSLLELEWLSKGTQTKQKAFKVDGAQGVIGAAAIVRIYSRLRPALRTPQILPGMTREILGTPPLKSGGIPR